MISVRLPDELENQIRETAARYDVSTSEFIRQVLAEKLQQEQKSMHPYELGQSLFGRYSSNNQNLAQQADQQVRAKLRQRHDRAGSSAAKSEESRSTDLS